jgi:hypothetical protein
MSGNQVTKLAAKFLKDQAEIMKKYGEAPKMSGASFQAAVNDTKKTFKALRSAAKASQ